MYKKESGKGLFFIEADNEIAAKMTYTMPSPDKMVIDHTEVHEELRCRQLDVSKFAQGCYVLLVTDTKTNKMWRKLQVKNNSNYKYQFKTYYEKDCNHYRSFFAF